MGFSGQLWPLYENKGEKGDKGDKGDPGEQGTINVDVPLPLLPLVEGIISSSNYVSQFVGVQTLDNFLYNSFGAAKYIIYCTFNGNRQICEILLLHDCETVASVEYANIVSSALLGTFHVDINLDFVRLLVDSPSANINYKVIRTLINN